MTATALIVDDEADIRELIAITLTRMGWDFHAAASLEEARNLLGLHTFDLCLTDMRLPDGNGVDFVKYAHKNKPHIPIAVITAHGNMEAAVDAMKNGAYDFVSKPIDISQLRQLVTQAVELNAEPANENAANEAVNSDLDTNKDSLSHVNTSSLKNSPDQASHSALAHSHSHGKTNTKNDNRLATLFLGESPLMQELHELIKKVARTNAPIWITGEAGTGKGLIARSIHEQGPLSAKPFITVNCGAIPGHLIESELFGHKKGSFTGATNDHDGLFLQANGGTLFLDEVDTLPPQVQIKLLRAIQERSVRPIGEREDKPANARILSASHADLALEVDAGRFRHDLYYRLNVISLRAPSLKERLNDIPVLVEHLLKELEHSQGIDSISINGDALALLNNYSYPGNFRELENILERARTLMDNGVIRACDIDLPEADNSDVNKPSATIHPKQSEDVEYTRIVDTLNKTHWNRKAAAEMLGLTYRQLRYRIQQLGIDKAA